jgi:hypothetical protein
MKHGAVMPHIVRTRLQLRAPDIALEPMKTETKSFHDTVVSKLKRPLFVASEMSGFD